MLSARLILLALLSLAPYPSQAAGGSGLPLPRFVSLKNPETNIRTGPGTRYPIQWVYRREGLPVEVVEEFDLWRKIRDAEGATGWVHRAMVDGKRHAMILGKTPQLVRLAAEKDAKPLLKAEPGVIAKLIECEPRWCKVQLSGRKGWIEKSSLWGAYQDEVFD
jgi:SH3-like domain-containing protein